MLNRRDLTLLTVGTVIGSGIFLVPASVLRSVEGSAGLALLVWVAGGILSLMGALTYAELGAMNPAAGGLYVYIRDAFGRFAAFLFGWTLFFVISTGTVATLAVAFATYLREIVPLSEPAGRAVSIGMIALLTWVNIRGTRQSADLTNWTTAVKAGAIVLMSAVLLWLGRGWSESAPAADGDGSAPTPLSGFGLGMIAVLWAYEGWQYPTYSAGETKNPQQDFPRALFAGVLILIALYLLANVAYLIALGPTAAAQSDSIAAAAVGALVGPAAAKLVALAIMISIFSAANSTALTAPRVFYAMARDRVFFAKLAEIHPHLRTPAVAILASGLWATVLTLAIGTFEKLLTYVVFIGWIFYGLAAASVFVFRYRLPGAERPYRVPGYPITPALFIAAAIGLVVNQIWAQPWDSLKGLAVVAAALPGYWLWRGNSSRQP
ncbi:MAG: amino acid permease [Firmicutes bacterium]|nr:amino acid permease [Bacillota bacterium]